MHRWEGQGWMDGLMDDCNDRWMAGWMDRCLDGWTVRMARQIRQNEKLKAGQMEGWVEGDTACSLGNKLDNLMCDELLRSKFREIFSHGKG